MYSNGSIILDGSIGMDESRKYGTCNTLGGNGLFDFVEDPTNLPLNMD